MSPGKYNYKISLPNVPSMDIIPSQYSNKIRELEEKSLFKEVKVPFSRDKKDFNTVNSSIQSLSLHND